jgi:hypothetical protein
VGAAFLSLPGAAQVVLPSFTDEAITGPTFINSAITAAPATTGVNVPAACPGSMVNLNLDGAVVQKILVNNNLPGAANLVLDYIETQNLGSLPGTAMLNATNGLVFYGVTDSGATYCISNTPVITGGTAPFLASAGPGLGVTIPTGISYINIAVQLQVANSAAYTSNANGQTTHLRTRLTFTTQLGGVNFIQHGTATVIAGTTFVVGLGGLEAVTYLGSSPADIAPVNSSPTIIQTINLVHNSRNVGVDTDIIDICVKNLGSALADEDIQAIDVLDSFGDVLASQPGSVLTLPTGCQGAALPGGTFNGSGGSAGFGVSLNRGAVQGTPGTWINYLLPNSPMPTRLQIIVRLRNTAISGRTVKLQTTFVTALVTTSLGLLTIGTNAQWVNPAVDPSVVMSNTVTLSNGSGILGVGDASVLQPIPGRTNPATANVPILVSNFPAAGFGGFSGTLNFDPNVVQIAGGCNGITGASVQSPSAGISYQYTVSCLNVNGSTGKANFSVNFVSGTPPTGGSNPIVYVAMMAAPRVAAGTSSQLSISLLSISDANGNPVTTSTSPGVITIRPLGDVDEDGVVDARDQIILANAINNFCVAKTTTSFGLTVTQLEEADVAPPFATPAHPPAFDVSDFNCNNITSADVAAIGQLALHGASASDLAQAAASMPLQIRALNVQPSFRGRTLQIRVEGSGITGLELAVYDLAGRLVASETANGNRLIFRVLSANGQPLANGVYLYTVTVRGANGQAIRAEVRKLVVLRWAR